MRFWVYELKLYAFLKGLLNFFYYITLWFEICPLFVCRKLLQRKSIPLLKSRFQMEWILVVLYLILWYTLRSIWHFRWMLITMSYKSLFSFQFLCNWYLTDYFNVLKTSCVMSWGKQRNVAYIIVSLLIVLHLYKIRDFHYLSLRWNFFWCNLWTRCIF